MIKIGVTIKKMRVICRHEKRELLIFYLSGSNDPKNKNMQKLKKFYVSILLVCICNFLIVYFYFIKVPISLNESPKIEEIIRLNTTGEFKSITEATGIQTSQPPAEPKIYYKDIPSFFKKLLIKNKEKLLQTFKAKNPDLYQIYNKKIKTLEPWNLLDSSIPPEKTLLPFLHIPKTAGTTFFGGVRNSKNKSEKLTNFTYQESIYPNPISNYKSFHSPGCRDNGPKGGTHCSFLETNECLKLDYAELTRGEKNLKNQTIINYFSTYPKYSSLWSRKRPESVKRYSDFEQIKYFSIIRNPISRVLSEFHWWKLDEKDCKDCKDENKLDRCIEKIEKLMTPSWTWPMKYSTCDLSEWIDANQQIAHNRQVRNFYKIPENLEDRIPSTAALSESNLLRKYVNNFGSGSGSFCSNRFGDLEYEFLMYIFEQVDSINEPHETKTGQTNDVRTLKFDQLLNENYRILVETIENIEENFAFIGLNEEMELSIDLMKLIFRVEGMDKILKSDSDRAGQKSRKNHKSHTSSAADDCFSEALLEKLFERNVLDVLLFDYFDQKLKLSLEFYTINNT